MPYERVIPRDFFNESKLLKCLGQISLLVHDGYINAQFEEEETNTGFQIDLDLNNGYLYCQNYTLFTNNGTPVQIGTAYNSKEPFPLYFYDEENEYLLALTNDGKPTPEFTKYLEEK